MRRVYITILWFLPLISIWLINLFLKYGFHADALVHIGTHGTHEWLPGKEAGLGPDDYPEALIMDVPNIYPYIVDNVGEGLQAKRRGQAVIIDHMTPPFDKASLNPGIAGFEKWHI